MSSHRHHSIKQSTHILPPCRICGEHGIGFHYGVTTCGACKGFFRRSLARKEPYICSQSSSCHVGPNTNRRQSCPKCRYDKCISLGMSKEASKLGRYTLIKKSKDLEEVMQHLQVTQPCQPPAITSDNNSDRTSHVSGSGSCFLLSDDEEVSDDHTTDTYSSSRSGQLGQSLDDDLSRMYYPRSGYDGTPMHTDHHNEEFSMIDCFIDNDNDTDTSCFSNSEPYTKHNKPFPMDTQQAGRITNQDESSCAAFESSSFYNSWTMCTTATSPSYTSPLVPTASSDNNNQGYAAISPQDDVHSTVHGSLCNAVQHQNYTTPFSSAADQTVHKQQVCWSGLVNDSYSLLDVSSQNMQSKSSNIITKELSSSPSSSSQTPAMDECASSTHILSPSSMLTSQPALETICDMTDQSLQQCYHDDSAVTEEFEGLASSTTEFSVRPDDEECPQTTTTDDSETIEDESSRKITHSKALTLAQIFNATSDSKRLKAQSLYVLDPNPMKSTLSMFERFPFAAFEKHTLAPLLKSCYDVSDWIDEYLLQSTTQHNRIYSKDHLPQEMSDISDFQVSSVVPFTHSSELLSSAHETIYDATQMDKLFGHLEEIHCRYYGPRSAFLSTREGKLCMEMFWKMCQMHDSLRGTLNLIDDDKYFSIAESTGIDVDKRKEWFYSSFLGFDKSIARDIKFYRAVPGFKQLSLKDRTTLMKGTFAHVVALRHTPTTDYDKDVCIDQERGMALRLTLLKRILPSFVDLVNKWSTVARRLVDLQPTFEEMLILKFLFIMQPDCDEELDNRQLVVDWHNAYLKCLLHLIRKSGNPNADDRFDTFLDILSNLKEMTARKLRNGEGFTNVVSKLIDSHEHFILMTEVLGYW